MRLSTIKELKDYIVSVPQEAELILLGEERTRS